MNSFITIYTEVFLLMRSQNGNECQVLFLLSKVDLWSNMFKNKTKKTTTELLYIISFENLVIFYEINYNDYKTGF